MARRNETEHTTLGTVLQKLRPALEESGVRSVVDLRRLASDSGTLRRLGISGQELAQVSAFASLSSLFPTDIAVALQEAGAHGLDALRDWNSERFITALHNAAIDEARVGVEGARFVGLHRLFSTGVRTDEIDGLRLDVPAAAVDDDDARRLSAAGVRTLDDWVAGRDRVAVEPAARQALDAHARLRAVGLSGEPAALLIAEGVTSARDIVRMTPDEIGRVTRRLSMAPGAMESVIRQAQGRMSAVTRLLDATRALDRRDRPVWWHKTDEVLTSPLLYGCTECSDELSALSPFAYFVYLVQLTGKPLNELDSELHQQFADLSPNDAHGPLPQVVICAEVLSRAFPPVVSEAERRAARWLLVGRTLLLPVLPSEIAQRAAQSLTGADVAGLASRLQAALSTPLEATTPAFTDEELQALTTVLDGLLADMVTAEVRADPAFAAATDAHVAAAVAERMAARLRPAYVDAAIILRDAYRQQSGKSDRQLFALLGIETNVGGCEEISRLDQAIRTLQAYLDRLQQAALSDSVQTVVLGPYQEYAAWRGARMGDYFPELRALWRGDVLASVSVPSAREPWDRGSIVFDRANTRTALRDQIKAAESAFKDARIAETTPPATDAAVAALPLFRERHGVHYAAVQRGFAALNLVLDADDEIQSALASLDRDEPGTALAKLEAAAQQLDALSALAFAPGSAWQQPSGLPSARFNELTSRGPAERRTHLAALLDALLRGPKRLFAPENADVGIAGLEPSGALTSIATSWHVDAPAYVVAADRIEKRIVSGTATSLRHLRYEGDGDAADFLNYVVQVDFTLKRQLLNGEFFGIAVRLNANGDTGYRLGIVQVSYGEGDDYGVRTELRLEKFDGAGAPSLSRVRQLHSTRGTDQFPFHLDRTFALSLSVHGTHLGGQIKTANQAETLELDDTEAQPFTKGTFGFLASPGVVVDFSNVRFQIEGATGYPPFYAPRRANLDQGQGRHQRLNRDLYNKHRTNGRAMALEGLAATLTAEARTPTSLELVGATDAAGGKLYVSFVTGQQAVDLDALDLLLDRSLGAAFYLRYAVLPTWMARAHLMSGDPSRAVELLHVLYDDDAPTPTPAAMYPRFMAKSAPERFAQDVGADARLMRLRLADAYLAWGEQLFREDTPDTRYHARRLYERVLALHGGSGACGCTTQLGTITDEIVTAIITGRTRPDVLDRAGPDVPWQPDPSFPRRVRAAGDLVRDLVGASGLPIDFGFGLRAAVPDRDSTTSSTADASPPGDRLSSTRAPDPICGIRDQLGAEVAGYRARVQAGGTLLRRQAQGRALLDEAELRVGLPGAGPISIGFAFGGLASTDDLFGPRTGPFDPDLTSPGLAPPDLGTDPVDMVPFPSADGVITAEYTFCVPPNPLRTHQEATACQMLDLLRTCRNILGFSDDLVPPLRFEALLRVARGFADLAHAAERDLLNFRQAFEQESFSLLQAEAALTLSTADIKLEALNADQAQGDAVLADLQHGQVAASADHFAGLIESGLSSSEQLALDAADTAVAFSAFSAVASVLTAAFTLGAGPTPAGAFGAAGNATGGLASAAQAVSSAASLHASYGRRAQEWRYQFQQSQWGVAIAQQNIRQAFGRLEIALERQRIAGLRRDLNADAVQFLDTKFLNGAMYLWMQRAIREQYRVRLNYAITAAYLAERALAFEVQNRAIDVIRFDYFDPRRDGLLGATRLQTDLATLENMKLALARRRLQLSKTISLAMHLPAEFHRFKRGDGHLPFSTLMDWFDRDFPGHYLRLIQSVRVSVVALVPPLDGIRAHLRNSGVSRVVIGPPYGPEFREETIRRNPEAIALSAPYQASGLFVLDFHDDLLLPFEGSGVATDWVFEMPRAANRFDFSTIADVLVTIDYTALESAEHRAQAIGRLGTSLQADRPFSFRHQLADAWYDLHHPRLTPPGGTPMQVEFEIRAEDFPANVDVLTMDEVSLYVAVPNGQQANIGRVELYKLDPAASPLPGGTGAAAHGLFTTRQSAVPEWEALRGGSPVGTWRLKLADAEGLFTGDLVTDMVLIVTYSGQTPGWPA